MLATITFSGYNAALDFAIETAFDEISLARALLCWLAVGLLHKLVAFRLMKKSWLEVYQLVCRTHAGLICKMKYYTCCPKRRARFLKCAKRCRRRYDETDLKEDTKLCQFSHAATMLCKLHLPPPLPLRSNKRKNKAQPPATKASADSTTRANPSNALMVPATPLIDLARMQQWKMILQRVNRREAKHRDADGLYPLHWACSGAPPVEVIQALIASYPSSAKKVDYEGSTALHFATCYSASFAVLEALLSVYPKAIRMQDKHGRTPLFHAVDRGAGLEILQLLVKTDPTIITTPCLPSHARHVNLSRAVAVRTPLYLAWAAVVSDRSTRENRRGKRWDKALFLFEEAARYEASRNPAIPRVHYFLTSVIALDIYLPDAVLALALKAHPEQARQVVDGQLPLSWAAALPSYSQARSCQVLQSLLAAFPSAAQARDVQGRSSLSRASASGKDWDAGLQELFEADPDALIEVDDESGLPSALLAAAAVVAVEPESKAALETLKTNDPFHLLSGKQHEWMAGRASAMSMNETLSVPPETRHLTTIYQLLQAGPSVLGHSAS